MKYTLNIRSLTVAGIITLCSSCSRERSQVAEVGGHRISDEEFRDRYKSYLANTSSRDNILLRQKILNNMINEKLIFDDIKRQGMDNDEIYQNRLNDISGQALLDAYAKKISLDTVSVSEQELWKEFRAYNSKVSARYLYAKKERDAWNLKRQLEQGRTFEALAKDIFEDPGLANNGGYLGTFGWGEMEPALEEAAFSLPVGALSDPVRLKVGWAIVKVETRVEQPLASEYDYEKAKEKLTRAVQDKKIVHVVKDVVEQIGQDLSPVFNETAAEQVFKNWDYLVPGGVGTISSDQETRVPGNISSLHFVSFRGRSWTVGEFLEKLKKTSEKQRKRVKSVGDVKNVAIGLATREILLDRARQAGLEHDPVVLAQITRVKEEYLLKRWAKSVQDTVGQNGWGQNVIGDYYEKNNAQYAFPPEVNVAEILVRTEGEATSLMNRLKKGANFSELAHKNSIRLWAAKHGGELGFGTKATFGILGEKLFANKIDQLLGPERVDPY